tara:strand:- start:1544 stop:1756 length:213 start_codon:yes stop_codon:yes gene_type:complete
MNMKSQIVTALRNKYESDVVSARVNLEVYLNNTVGVAEHPDVIESVNGLIEIIAEAQDKLAVLDEMEENG